MAVDVDTAVTIFDGMGDIFRAGARRARQWTYNNDAQVLAAIYEDMADEAAAQSRALLSRHD